MYNSDLNDTYEKFDSYHKRKVMPFSAQAEHFKPYQNYSEEDNTKWELDQLLQAGRQIKLSIYGNLLIGFLTLLIMWNQFPKAILSGWIMLLIISILFRTSLHLHYQKVRPESIRRWKGYFIAASFFSGIVWGIGGILIKIYAVGSYSGIEVFILGGLAASAIAIHTPIRFNYPAFMVPMLSLIAVFYLYQNDTPHLLMAAMIITFMFILWSSSLLLNKLLFEKHTMYHVAIDTYTELQESEQRLKDITSSMGEGVLVVNKEGMLTFINPEGERILGWSFRELTQDEKEIYPKIHKEEENILENSLIKRSVTEDKTLHSDKVEFKRKNGKTFPVSMTAAPIHSKDASKEGVVVVFQDITVQKELENKLEKLALYDALTGLYNRGKFDEVLESELSRTNRYEGNLSLLIIDIDFFKKINDTHGHQNGDHALKYIANLILSSIRSSDYVARYGGEEFVVILPETDAQSAIELAERIRISIEQKALQTTQGKTICLTASIGIASRSSRQVSPKLLIEIADKALYKAKKNGRNQIQYVSHHDDTV